MTDWRVEIHAKGNADQLQHEQSNKSSANNECQENYLNSHLKTDVGGDKINDGNHEMPDQTDETSLNPASTDTLQQSHMPEIMANSFCEEHETKTDNIKPSMEDNMEGKLELDLNIDTKEKSNTDTSQKFQTSGVDVPSNTDNGKPTKSWSKLLPAEEKETPIGFEAVLMELGDPGKFFNIQFFIHMLNSFCLSSTVLVYVFTGYEPPHACKRLTNETSFLSENGLDNTSAYEVNYGKCGISVVSNTSGVMETVASFGCANGHDYHGEKYISFVSEWDMVCDNVGLKELVQAILMVGQTVGAVVFTSIADKYGRKPVLLACNLLLGGAGMGVAYSPNIYVLIAFRFLCGFFQQGVGIVGHTILMEFLTAKNRRVIAVLCGLFWTITIVLFGVLAYLMRTLSWRLLQMATALFACNVLISLLFLSESPRWLCANKKYTQALAIVKRACKMNGRDYEKVQDVFERHVIQQDAKNVDTPQGHKVERYSLVDIMRHRTLLISTLIMWFVWITNSTTYYGLFLVSSSLAGNRHVNFILLGLSDFPSDLISLVLFAYFGRKPIIMGWLIVAGCGLLTATMLLAFGSTQVTSILSIVFSCMGKLGIGGSFNSLFMYTPELFPTNLRSAGLGVCSSVSRLGGMISPYSQALADVVLWGPGLIFSAMCFLSAILFTKLPETRGLPMPNTIRDMKLRVAHHYKASNANTYEIEILQDQKPNINS